MDAKIDVSIIGTASGKGKYEALMTQKTWDFMCTTAENHINKLTSDWSNVHIVSGGAAWSDHVAVHLFLKYPKSSLTLHFPCKWNSSKKQFEDNGKYHWAANPGRTANLFHFRFGRIIGTETLPQIQKAIDNGAIIVDNYVGFHDRNLSVGKSSHLIAFTASKSDQPTDGGTFHTWENATSKYKTHYSIDN
jgi:hypothetical protein